MTSSASTTVLIGGSGVVYTHDFWEGISWSSSWADSPALIGCIHRCVYVCMCVCVCVCVSHTYMYVQVMCWWLHNVCLIPPFWTSLCCFIPPPSFPNLTYSRLYVCMYVCMYNYVCKIMHVCMYVCMYVCMCMCILFDEYMLRYMCF